MSRSLQYWNTKRAKARLPRIRHHSKMNKIQLSNMVMFKVGMLSSFMIDDSSSATGGTEIMKASTIFEIPKTEMYGVRIYKKDSNTKYISTSYDVYESETTKKVGIKPSKKSKKLKDMMDDKKEITELSALLVADPRTTNISQHHLIRFESRILGSNIEKKLKFASDKLGKEITINDIFEDGEYIDVVSISKGKGWQGVIRRGGVKRNNHKSTQKIRHGGPLGAYSPGKVMYTIPRAGQQGSNYRTEQNKRILKIYDKTTTNTINPKGGFKGYGNIKNNFIIIQGSVPGPSKRMVRIKKAIRGRNSKGIKKPKLIETG